jgi:thioredoxin 1
MSLHHKGENMKDINAEEYAALQNSENPVVIDFHATWCGPCKVLSPILEELESEVENVDFVKLDVDQYPEIAGANQVMGVPTVVLKDGEVKERFVGVQPKETIKEKITALS